MTEHKESEVDEEYKKLCAKHRMSGYMLLVVGGVFSFIAQLVVKNSSSREETQGAYIIPAICFLIGICYLLSKPKRPQPKK